ncbi:MAG: bifunctional 3-(3-hydroxy-phenyl)propionate/3-hydroxycinnamic acid hydroxylase [Phenylobacterium sp.]|uniref:bifunctional 3-(3-hydroxy-phenyl)propionate/3-hydroxycinnamic acid hydroxylase MhpA n=1 Tax=Phenylobacterium sp. TaxID=1871053 RepID=UPI001A43C69E|nr:bifunctional 3-(3-hydroxy-phenyl)propionate/3-hydroxycinnamic acid hydroxylase [Phenylobacterium sp.]MBL8773386.1 bifunctional 3-(3-hydroxy-phenyl)propionate/3-hydroxycinnamic acid hydroxylase [Phenylobacterium sp.]
MSRSVDVLIVGMGPTGATLAALLGDLGVKTLVIEKDTEVYPLPRAAHFDHEIMRLFQQLGVAEAVARHARPAPAYEFRAADGQLLMRFDSTASATPSGWRASYMFHQPGVELALRDRLATLPSVEARTGWKLAGFKADGDGVEAALEGPQGVETVHARWLVGCDGASSAVRAGVGGELFDYGFDEPWLVVDVKVGEGARTPEVNLQICDPARPTTCVLMGPGRHRWEFMLLPGEDPAAVVSDDFIRPLIEAWDVGDIELERRAVYRFHGLVAKTWRSGRVLLAGDAAHQMPPFAGQGMCSGLRDAANLAWKLAAVLGGADDALLDTYQTEREPHVRGYVELAIQMGRTVCTLDRAEAAARDAAMLAATRPPVPMFTPSLGAGCLRADDPAAGALFIQTWSEGRGLDDELGSGPWLIARTEPPAAAGVVSVGLDRLAPAHREGLSAWLDRHGASAVLVRPDRYVFGAGDPGRLLQDWRARVAAPALA